MKNYKNFNNGYTLIEMIAVMAIIAIVTAFALPSVFALNTETDTVALDSKTSAIYKVVSTKAVETMGRDTTKIFNLNYHKNFFALQNISDDEVFFCFSDKVDTSSATAIQNIVTTFDNKTISTLKAENPNKFIILIPITDTTSNKFDFTKDVIIFQPGTNVKYINGIKDFS